MQGRRSLGEELVPFVDNINKNTKRIREEYEQFMETSEEESFEESTSKMAEDPRMKDFTRPIISTFTSCIQLGEAARNYELKYIHFNQLPSFYGMPNKEPLNFIRKFYSIVQTFPLQALNEDQLRMRCFSYTLKERAKIWLLTLVPNYLATWNDV